MPVQQKILAIDDHEAILEGTLRAIKEKFPLAEILTARDARSGCDRAKSYYPELVILDLSLPEKPNCSAHPEIGIQLLKTLMQLSPAPNIMVLSTNIKPLVCLKPAINTYEGGFAAMDKSQPTQEMLKHIETALQGSIYLPSEVRSRPEFDCKWLELLKLKFQAGLTDRAIAQRMAISDRTLRNYWQRLQDALGVDEDPNRELKTQIEKAARKIGLIS